MRVADPAEADRIYLELKERAMRTERFNVKQKQISMALVDESEFDHLENIDGFPDEDFESR